MYPTEAFGLAPLLLRAAGLATPRLAGVQFPVTFSTPPESGGVEDYDIASILDKVLASKSAVVGMSCYVWNRDAVLELADAIRRLAPQTYLVVGGPEVETREAAAAVLNAGAFDVAVRGEGEVTFPDLLLGRLDGIADGEWPLGVSARRDGGILETPDRAPIEPLDSVATPFHESISDFRGINRIPCFETYRGCRMRCKFCNWGKARGVRFFGLERVKHDLDFILNLDIDRIWFVDSIFNLEQLRYKEILRHLIAANRRGIACDFEMMGELLDEQGIHLIAQLPKGSSIAFGLQSTDHEVVREAWRPHNFRRFEANIRALRAAAPHVDVLIDLIFGMPRDTPEKFQRSILAAADLNPTRIQVHPFMVLTGTQFYDEREALSLQRLWRQRRLAFNRDC